MATLDWVFLAILLVSLLIGAWRGLVYEVLSVFSWLAAFFVAQWLAPDAALWLPMGGASQSVRYAAGFVVVFIIVVFMGGLLAWLTKKLVESVGLRPVDRTLGAAFGLIRGGVLLLAFGIVINLTPLQKDEWWTQAQGAGIVTAVLKGLKPVLPEQFGQYLPG
jgi:membrane protein required for colicin V production